jgi:hypothetical protein
MKILLKTKNYYLKVMWLVLLQKPAQASATADKTATQ